MAEGRAEKVKTLQSVRRATVFCARCCWLGNSADMLDVIGAGATAHSTIDWHLAWMNSPARQEVESQLQEILQGGMQIPVKQKQTQFSAPFSVQLLELTRRTFLNYFRSPTYFISKNATNVFAGKHRN